ncbi:MAG: TetR/AcrR family transcriptional regulator [bacterium]|nr:TetR/AcrR family transcriptional regulator [bacterium]
MPPTASPLLEPASAPLRKGELTAIRILVAAESLFAERGYAGTSLRDVAAAVGLRIPSLYNHFKSKELLYAAVLDRVVDPVLDILNGFLAAPVSERPTHAEVIGQVMALLDGHPNLPALLLQETQTGGRRLTPGLRHRLAPIFGRAFETVQATDEAGRFEPDEIPLFVLALYHVIVGFHSIAPFYREVSGDDLSTPESRDRQIRFLTRMVEALFEHAPVRS